MAYTLIALDGKTCASFIPERGGICNSFIVPDRGEKTRELLFLHDYFDQSNWPDLPGGWPFLFPVCARVMREGRVGEYLHKGKIYQMPMHGFAWRNAWQVIAEAPDSLKMRLQDTAATRDIFPFQFSVELFYQVSAGKLICEQTYHNLSDEPMPYSAGFHPYFLTPKGAEKAKVQVDFSPITQFCYNETYTKIIGEKIPLSLPRSIMDVEINEQLFKLGENKTARLIYPDGFGIEIAAEGMEDKKLFSYLQLYTMPEKPFFCVEPWMSFPNAINSPNGMRWLPAGTKERAVTTVSTFHL